MFFLEVTGFDCGGADILRIIKFIFRILDIILFIIPMVLIVMISVDLAKNVLAGREDEMKKNVSIAIKRIVYCLILFLVPTIVSASISLLGNVGVDYATCIDIAKTHDLSLYEIDYGDEQYNVETPDFSGNDSVIVNDSTDNGDNNDSNSDNKDDSVIVTSKYIKLNATNKFLKYKLC